MTVRVALSIGVAGYPDRPLINSVDDASRAAKALKERGFNVTILADATAVEIEEALAEFRSSAAGADIALVFLAGHAVERHGVGYFLPVDFQFPITASKARLLSIRLNDLVEATAGAKARIVVLDACRDWPADPRDQLLINNDLDELAADERVWRNVLLAFSTSASSSAGDGLVGQGSAFCEAFCRHLLNHTLNADECFRRISQEVLDRSKQQPWTYSSLDRGLTFSDLARFSVLQRHVLPKSAPWVTEWATPNQASSGIYAGLGGPNAWSVSLAGFRRLNYGGTAELVGAADLVGYFLLAGRSGELFLADGSATPATQVGINPSFGIAVSPDRDGFIHYGHSSAVVFSATEDAILSRCPLQTDFDVYCCVYITKELVWLAGEDGNILEVDLSTTPLVTRATRLVQPINAMALSPDKLTVFVAGQGGLLISVDRFTFEQTGLLGCRRPQTAAGIRSALLDVAEDEAIRDYIFGPSKLPVSILEELEGLLPATDFPSCAHAPSLPILAVGTNESTLLLIDTRDWQIFQEIDLSTGFPGAVSGLIFLSDTELVMISAQGHAIFLASA